MIRKYKIAFVSNTSWSLYNFRLGVINALRDKGYDILLVAPFDNYSNRLVAEGYHLVVLPMHKYTTNPFKDIRLNLLLFKIYKEHKPDFIFHYTIKPNIYGSLMAAILGIPSIAINTGLGMLAGNANLIVGFISRLLYRTSLKFSREVWFLNKTDKDFFIKMIHVPDKKVNILPGEGVNTKNFKPVNINSEHPETIFIFAGRMLYAKGLKELAGAAQMIRHKYSDVHFHLLGFIDPQNPNSVSIEQIESWQKEGIFRFLGETENVIPYLREADCIIQPSYREGVSRLLLEASALGKPSIATDVVGCRDVIENNITGLLCKSHDVDDLYLAIEKFILMDKNQQLEMGKRAREKVVREFDEKIIIQKYLDKLEQYLPDKVIY